MPEKTPVVSTQATEKPSLGSGQIQIFVKCDGFNLVTYSKYINLTLIVHPSESVQDVMQRICVKIGISPDDQRLVYCAKQLRAGSDLLDYNIQNGSTLHLLLRLYGGMDSNDEVPLDDKSEEKETDLGLEMKGYLPEPGIP